MGPVGTSVTLIGTNFTGATKVAFNGTAAPTYSVDQRHSDHGHRAERRHNGQDRRDRAGGHRDERI